MTREISIKTNDSNQIVKKRVNVTTMDDVAKEFPEVNFEATRVVIRNPRKTITSMNETLPIGDLFLFTFPEKNKSGFLKK